MVWDYKFYLCTSRKTLIWMEIKEGHLLSQGSFFGSSGVHPHSSMHHERLMPAFQMAQPCFHLPWLIFSVGLLVLPGKFQLQLLKQVAVSQKGMKLRLVGLTWNRGRLCAWAFTGYAAAEYVEGLFNGCLDGEESIGCGKLGSQLRKRHGLLPWAIQW